MNHILTSPFKSFLLVYGGFLIFHLYKMGISSVGLLAGLLAGAAFAIIAHRRHGYLPIIFLVGHMLIEWYSHSIHGNHYTNSEYFFHGVHALLDCVFLFTEVQQHFKKYAYIFLAFVFASLAGVVLYFYVPSPSQNFANSPLITQALQMQRALHENHGHTHDGSIIHFAVIGGMLGCVISHLFFASRWKHFH